MIRRLQWVLVEADAILALGIAIVVGILGLLNVTSQALATNAVLVTLAVLALSVLRDRTSRSGSDQTVQQSLDQLTAEIRAARQVLHRIEPVAEVLVSTERALSELTAVKVLRGGEVGQALAEARRQTDRWLFKGATGTYIRAVTLPEIYRTARQERRGFTIRLEILDPTDGTVCDRYARFRRSVSERPDGTGETWTKERVHEESYATILAACWYADHFNLLDFRIGLSRTMSTFRYDMSASSLVITQDDAKIPALLVARDNFLFDSFDSELLTSLEQAKQVPLDQAAPLRISDEPSDDEVRLLFEALGLPFVLSADHVSKVIQKALHAKNPYT